MRKRGQEPEKENNERWLITYSDLITLLLIFFVVMYTLSKVDANKYHAIASSLAKTMGGSQSIMESGGPSMVPGASESKELDTAMEQIEQQKMEKIKKQIQEYVDKNGLSGKVTVAIEERGVVVSFQDVVLFPLGVADLVPHSQGIVDKVGAILSQTPNYIRVEGHTDNLPIQTNKFPSNWELSLARSASVVHRLINFSHIPPDRLSATGYGEYRPRRANDSDANRQQNRRVDIIVLRTKYQEVEPEAMQEINTLSPTSKKE
ncbi:OmpA/MotB domain protein [Desulforamulus reducens MI-1]|uniref:OmpA/MotB domain protein n=1 Tax=Desulforamulus reducens (strain ATCC BAA-1160 / DSM 100696 / MI-1) TaxID=349161 RepID=A4J799_DESRM|nr:flagellar motor protein MotB [Desulforamulus reducens]ABO50952.1 OmpA/MotB domain protein [Desulforamulus reducens MI-1]